ncbi:65-kDa microtubule-associated protein 3-like [Capsella rubella]|uniref:65-kDa microtubule-associated protein 3-like n=1 Tax=Capsella rubella TaxID=81985 RepID=UPI000CD5081A|nr:65-kDa microtubule-associated protein 3-like [Capsella rubella]
MENREDCGSLLLQLKSICRVIGDSVEEVDEILMALNLGCNELYKAKVREAEKRRVQMDDQIKSTELEIAKMKEFLGESSSQQERPSGGLKKHLESVLLTMNELIVKKTERKKQFREILLEIVKIDRALHPGRLDEASSCQIDWSRYSDGVFRKLQRELNALQTEKDDRVLEIKKLWSTLKSHCSVLHLDTNNFFSPMNPTSTNPEGESISDDTVNKLRIEVQTLGKLKTERILKARAFGTTMKSHWALWKTPDEEKDEYVTIFYKLAAPKDEINDAAILSEETLRRIEEELHRLQEVTNGS